MNYLSNIIKREQIEPIAYLGDKAINVQALLDRSVTIHQFESMEPANSFAFCELIPKLDNHALKYVTQQLVQGSRKEQENTYDWVIKHKIIPELMKRIS